MGGGGVFAGGGELKYWSLGGHENVNPDVSEAIYSSLGIHLWGLRGGLL